MLQKEVKLLDGPLSCLSENVGFTQLAVGGRNVFKIFDCQKQNFQEVANLRNGIRSQQSHLSINDVNWCKADEKTLVSASIQGAVVIWDVAICEQSKQVFVISENQRSVNCLEFQPNSNNLLMAASQDGSCRVIDLRKHESTTTYGPTIESPAREVKFNPRNANQFSAAFENGFCQIWDMRKPSSYMQNWVAHSGPCVCMDWHPTENWLITGGRDKTAAVWDFSSSLDFPRKIISKYSAETVASIGKVKWRPKFKYQVLVTPMLTESHASVWDVRRPFLADVYFVEHKDSIGDVIWKDENMFYTCGRDSKLCRFIYKDHVDIRGNLFPLCLSTSIYGRIMCCKNEKELYYPNSRKDNTTDTDETDSTLTQSSITTEHCLECLTMEPFLKMAKGYRLQKDSFSNLCYHNSQVAKEAEMHQISKTWLMLKTMFEENKVKKKSVPSEATTHNQIENALMDIQDTVVNKMPASAINKEEQLQRQLLSPAFNEVFNITNDVDIFNKDIIEDEESDYDTTGTFVIEQDLDFPKETQWRSKLSDLTNSDNFHDDSESPSDYLSVARRIEVQDVVKKEILTVTPFFESIDLFDYCPIIVQMLCLFADQNDVQTAVSMALVLGDRIRPHLDPKSFDFWVNSYIEKLNDFMLFIQSTDVYNAYQPIEPQPSVSIRLSCSMCSRLLKQGWLCRKCPEKNRSNFIHQCALCNLPVKGHYIWCQGCCHGGHYKHITQWFASHKQCPTGCGHYCEYN